MRYSLRINHMLTAAELAENFGTKEYVQLCAIVEETWTQAFGVIEVQRLRKKIRAEIELEDRTHHKVSMSKRVPTSEA